MVDLVLLAFLAVVAVAVIRLRNLFAVVMLTGIYSLLSAGLFVSLDAVDVAFTEAAVGAGISTVLMLGTIALTTDKEKIPTHTPVLPLIVVFITGAALLYGTLDMPPFGDPTAPIHNHVVPYYISESPAQTGLPNIVTSILASYRGYDTMGELAVIFTAGIGVMILLGSFLTTRPTDGAGSDASPGPKSGSSTGSPESPTGSPESPTGSPRSPTGSPGSAEEGEP